VPRVNIVLNSVASSVAVGGTPTTGSVTLSNPAQAGGVVVNLSSTNPAVASVPATVLVPQGAVEALFTINVASVTSNVDIPISASFNGVTVTTGVIIAPGVPLKMDTQFPRWRLLRNSPERWRCLSMRSSMTASPLLPILQFPGRVRIKTGDGVPLARTLGFCKS
jgi:hypothetical protein